MSNRRKRLVEVRMTVVAVVNVREPSLMEALAASGGKRASLVHVVSSEVVSNLESVPYIEAVAVRQL